MASKALALNDSGRTVAVFTDVSGSAASVQLTLIDATTGQIVPVVGITTIKTLRNFLSERIRKFDFEEAANDITERNLQNGS